VALSRLLSLSDLLFPHLYDIWTRPNDCSEPLNLWWIWKRGAGRRRRWGQPLCSESAASSIPWWVQVLAHQISRVPRESVKRIAHVCVGVTERQTEPLTQTLARLGRRRKAKPYTAGPKQAAAHCRETELAKLPLTSQKSGVPWDGLHPSWQSSKLVHVSRSLGLSPSDTGQRGGHTPWAPC
jgi:hypothetical protein